MQMDESLSSLSSRCGSPTFSAASRTSGSSRKIPRKPVPSMQSFQLEGIRDAFDQLDQEETLRRASCNELMSPAHERVILMRRPTRPQENTVSDGAGEAATPCNNELWASSCHDEPATSLSRQAAYFDKFEILASSNMTVPDSTKVPRRTHTRGAHSFSSIGSALSNTPSNRTAARLASLKLPPLDLPHLPTLFPSADEQPYHYVAEPTPTADEMSNPLEAESPSHYTLGVSSASSSSLSSKDSSSTPPTSAPSSPRPSIVRMLSGSGRKLFGRRRSSSSNSASSDSNPGSETPKVRRQLPARAQTKNEMLNKGSDGEGEILIISMANARRLDGLA